MYSSLRIDSKFKIKLYQHFNYFNGLITSSSSSTTSVPSKSRFITNFYFRALLFIIILGLIISGLIILFIWSSSPSSHIAIYDFIPFYYTPNNDHGNNNSFVLQDIDKAPLVIIQDTQFAALPFQDDCNHYNCFDVYHCDVDDEQIKIYIYPVKRYVDDKGVLISSPITAEFWEILETIFKSEYYTSDPEKACIFVPSIDLLSQSYVRLEEISQVLASLPFWNEGSNHILFNMLPGSFPDFNTRIDLNTGKAMIAGGGFDTWTYRSVFDIPIPVYSPNSAKPFATKDEILNHQKNWLVISTQSNAISSKMKNVLMHLEEEYPSDLLLLAFCATENNFTKVRCNNDRSIVSNYPAVLRDSKFCLIIRTAYLGHPVLSDSLMSGCIPVIVSDNYVLPFEEIIDWKRVSIKVHEHDLPNLINILKEVTEDKITQMQHQTLYIWKTFFSSIKVITLTTLKILNSRLFPHTVIPKESWNLPLLEDYKPKALISPKLSSRLPLGFTALILTYDRLDSLFEVINRVVQAPSCSQVLVIWNNQRKKPPPEEKWPKISVPLKIIQTKANKLSNRFYPYQEISTEAILAIDDDIVMLTADELEFGFQVWREFADRIVGFPSRVHRWDNISSKWRYESEWTNDVSMVLTGAAFYHKYYNYLYSFEMPNEIRNWVDEQMNCEDIAMNFLVSNVTGKAPIKVAPRKKFKCPECTTVEMLSSDVLSHLTERSECINKFTAIYGKMPLKVVEFRADPLLYKDNLPEKLKKFNQIGSL